MVRPRVLLVDDDASIRRFVAMALEDLELDLTECASVAQAIAALRARGPVDLLITDLMMPGENGLALLQRLADEPGLRGQARLAVFSAGLQGAMQAELARHDIWRQLSKPVSARELESCVREAVAGHPPDGAPGEAPAEPGGMAGEQEAVLLHFSGDRALFLAFRRSCLPQFGHDIARGDAALLRADMADLRHLAHSLKSVLLLLGENTLSNTARQLEEAAARHDAGQAALLWPQLRAGLAGLAATPG
jgi:CheY-like chemotaxis protein/HPt (histidine-containing phosphotransfer) domain-containing protein